MKSVFLAKSTALTFFLGADTGRQDRGPDPRGAMAQEQPSTVLHVNRRERSLGCVLPVQ